MSKQLKTTGDLREFLANMVIGVKNGDVKVEEARTIIKGIEKITENYYAEIKVAQLQLSMGLAAEELGKLKINQ